MKKRFLLLYPFLVIGFFIISVTCTYGQRGGRGGFSRGGFGGSGFSSGFSRNFGGGYNRSFGGNIYNEQISRINRNMAIGRIGIGAGMGTTLYRSLPSSYQRIKFRGVRYYFYDGLFFDYYGGYYRSIFPPIGLTIASLPYGYWGFNYGGFPYFYHTGIYYQQHENNYQVVDAPVGASVPQLPKDAKVVVINNENYFEYNGTYYKEYLKQDGSKWYLIAGLHGVLNTTPEVTISSVKQLHVGDVIDVLPNDCKVVVIDNKKYYVSSDNIYFEEFIENNVLKYKVVGK